MRYSLQTAQFFVESAGGALPGLEERICGRLLKNLPRQDPFESWMPLIDACGFADFEEVLCDALESEEGPVKDGAYAKLLPVPLHQLLRHIGLRQACDVTMHCR